MKSVTVTEIRRTGTKRINQLVRAHRFLEQLRPAFAEWIAGEIYVCAKTGDYRYRFGDRSKSITPWSKLARSVFSGPESLAFAAMVLGAQLPEALTAAPAKSQLSAPATSGRVDVVALAAKSVAA